MKFQSTFKVVVWHIYLTFGVVIVFPMISFRARKLSTLLSSTFFKNWKGQKILWWYVNLFTSACIIINSVKTNIFFNIGNTHFVWLKLFLFWGVRLLIALQMYSITVRLHQFNILIWPTSSCFNKTIQIIFLISRSIFFLLCFFQPFLKF